jgi:hypothetical protein
LFIYSGNTCYKLRKIDNKNWPACSKSGLGATGATGIGTGAIGTFDVTTIA